MLLRYASVWTFILEGGILCRGGVMIFLAMAKGRVTLFHALRSGGSHFFKLLVQTSTPPPHHPPGNLWFSYNLEFFGRRNAESTNGGKRPLHGHRVNYLSHTCCCSCITNSCLGCCDQISEGRFKRNAFWDYFWISGKTSSKKRSFPHLLRPSPSRNACIAGYLLYEAWIAYPSG